MNYAERRDIQINAAIYLARRGLQMVLLEGFFGALGKNNVVLDAWKNRDNPKGLRDGVWWLNSLDQNGAIAADRVYRLILERFPNVTADSFSWRHLIEIDKSFTILYPSTVMDVNRIYYLIQNIKERKVIPRASCLSCSRPYLVMAEGARRRCGVCEHRVRLKARAIKEKGEVSMAG